MSQPGWIHLAAKIIARPAVRRRGWSHHCAADQPLNRQPIASAGEAALSSTFEVPHHQCRNSYQIKEDQKSNLNLTPSLPAFPIRAYQRGSSR